MDFKMGRAAKDSFTTFSVEHIQCSRLYCVLLSLYLLILYKQRLIYYAVFTLSTQKVEKGASLPWKEDKNCFLYALSTGEEAYSTAQERALAQLRDGKDNYPTALACDLIAPAPAVQTIMAQESLNSSDVVPEAALEEPRVARKATTAAAFFGKKKSAGKTSTTTSTADTTKKVAATSSSATSKAASRAKGGTKSSSTVPSMFQRAAAASSSSSSNQKPKATVQQDEKENNKRPKTVGNADDFVGDEEESDDEQDEEMEPEQAVVRGRPDDQVMVVDDEEDEEEEKEESAKAKPKIYGAMDDFAKPKEPKPVQDDDNAPKHRRRRKTLVTKTTMDKSGYLHTETQEVWVDIPTDEEGEEAPKKVKPAAPAPSRSKQKVVKPSGMKQGSLASFFAKKK